MALCLPDITRNTVCDALGWLWSTILATPVLRDSMVDDLGSKSLSFHPCQIMSILVDPERNDGDRNLNSNQGRTQLLRTYVPSSDHT